MTAPKLFTIAEDLAHVQILAQVDEADIGQVTSDNVVSFTVDAYPEEEFRGRIAQIRLNATVTANVVSYPVMIEVPNPDERLRPKMTANVTIDVATAPDVIRIPNAALRFKPEADTKARPQATATSSRGGAGSQGGGQQPSAEQRAAGGLGRGGRGIGDLEIVIPCSREDGLNQETVVRRIIND